ncbi:2-hydroxyacid dehydrogenase [uncultured Cohaesibacter sp.]|uniref:2-hydroxyacid dehydrogenase n=1 Tax=uncultured Cohaesibacter sp. TaxID=1002546 RepID=UPI00292F3DC8|nr:2-hydroxyacid dehydrogenase [uncultured Cohaesibacter sp.]
MTLKIAVIGDQFMLASTFEQAIKNSCSVPTKIRTLNLDFPDVPMRQGREEDGTAGLKEFLGDPDPIADFIGDAELLVTHLAPLSADMLKRLPNIKMVAVARGGPVNVDINAVRERNIRIVNTPGRNASAVAEFTIGAILSQTHNIVRGHDGLRKGNWRGELYRADITGDELCDMTVGVIGYSEIGRLVVKFLRAFGCKILISDPYVDVLPEDADYGVRKTDLDELLEASDVVTLHARLTPETKEFINADAFARMKKGAVLVNTARGQLVDQDALIAALSSGHLHGAALDTFAVEPPEADSPLLSLENVTLTPHVAGASLRTVRVTANKIAEEVRRYIANESPVNPC